MKKSVSLSFLKAANEVAPPPEGTGPQPDANDLDRLRAAGINVEHLGPIEIKLYPGDFYNLLKFIEGRAVNNSNYYECRQAVLWSEYLREQARKQGR